MKTLFNDPVHWTASTVGTQARFALMCVLHAGLVGWGVMVAASEGVQAAAGLALMVVVLQCVVLYALRALYVRLVGQGAAQHVPATGQGLRRG